MYRFGLKLWSTNTSHYLQEAYRLYNEHFFDYIELYVVPNSIETLPKWVELDIPFNIHAPHFLHKFNLSQREYLDNNLQLFSEVKEFADELDAENIIFHGGIDGNYKETAYQLNKINDERSLIENKPFKILPTLLNHDNCVGSSYLEIKYIMEHTGVGFCLDIGHGICAANSFHENPYRYIEQFLNLHPKMFHLTDLPQIDQEFDSHLNLGNGKLDLKRILEILPYNATITVETEKSSLINLDDFIADIKFLKEMIK